MKVLKKGQTVYFYQVTGPFMGEIIAGRIVAATKDLTSNTVSYEIEMASNFPLWPFTGKITLTAEHLYTNYKTIAKEYKEELVYNALLKKFNDIQDLLKQILEKCREQLEKPSFQTLALNNNAEIGARIVADDLVIQNRHLADEVEELKKEIEAIKKKIKPKTKKPVVKEGKK